MADVVVEALAVTKVKAIAMDAVALAAALPPEPLAWVVPVAVMALAGRCQRAANPGSSPAQKRGGDCRDEGAAIHASTLPSYAPLRRPPMLDHSSRA